MSQRRTNHQCSVPVASMVGLAAALLANVTKAEDDMSLQLHGFVSQGAIKTTANNYLAESERGSLEFAEAGVNLTKPLADDLRVGMQLFSRDLGPIGNYEARFDWFFLDYRAWDWLGIRVGRTKVPFGLYNETSDVDAARIPVLLPQSVYPTTSRDYLLAQTGLEVYGSAPLGALGQAEYRLYGGTIFLDSNSSTTTEVSVPYIFGGRLMWLPTVDGLQLGGSVQALRLDIDYTPPDEQVDALQMAGQLPADFEGPVEVTLPAVLAIGSIEYSAYDFTVAAEYSRWLVELQSSEPVIVPESKTTSERAYAMASYRVAPWFAPGVYYSVLFADTKDRTGRDAYQHDVAATFRYDLTPNWLVKAEGHYMHGTAALSPALNDAPPSELQKDWGLFLLKTTAYF